MTPTGRSKCSMYAVDFTKIPQNGSIYQDQGNWPVKPCTQWEYNRTDIPYATISTNVGSYRRTFTVDDKTFFKFFS